MYTPNFSINNKILKNIGDIEAAKQIIEHAPLVPYWEKKFQDEALVRTTHYGTHIEGNELSLTQVQKILDGEKVVARERDVQEVINYRKVLEYIDRVSNSKINEDTIRELHKIVVKNVLDEGKAGNYRDKEVVIRNSITGDVAFKPPKAVEAPWQMKELVIFINEEIEIHPVLKGGIVHYEFVRIHPFLDGNGRVGRALSMLMLYKLGYDIRQFFSLEEHFDRDPDRYYEALQSIGKNNGDQTEWLVYFTECLAAELSKIKDRIENISIDSNLKKKLGGPVMLSDRQLKIIEYIQANGYIENRAYDTLFPMVSEDTVLREVQDLVKKGILKKQGVTKGVKYIMQRE
ncbi:MAG: Fic family protein, partial [Candidatus Levybacteria bacterium]|nr:Fic family protein [Candidatus Levybacteria bacterium]